MSDQPRFKLTFHGPGSFGIFLLSLWLFCYALTTLLKVEISSVAMGIIAFFAAVLLLVGA